MVHDFIKNSLIELFGEDWGKVYTKSLLLNYINLKTKSVDRDSKSRGSFGNLYAIYVLVEDYLKKGFDTSDSYSSYSGANFSDLFRRQRELPFGQKLQNHALNHRCNQEFQKFFPQSTEIPIRRETTRRKYWINEKLLKVKIDEKEYNIAKATIRIIDDYIKKKIGMTSEFLDSCEKFKTLSDEHGFHDFVKKQLSPTKDARIFEIVSFVIMKWHYSLKNLTLYKTGRTNANDGGIDFVMRPEGRFFQVSEVLDFKKYFLDIEKIHRYPITFVIKSGRSPEELLSIIEWNAKQEYDSATLVKFMDAIEEIISIPTLLAMLEDVRKHGKIINLLDDLIIYYKTEFNIE